MSAEIASLEVTLVRWRYDGRWIAGFKEIDDCPADLVQRLKEAVCETLKKYNDENN